MTTSNKAEARAVKCVEYAHARRVNRVTRQIGNSTPWFLGVYRIQGIDITIGQDCMVAWNGMDSSVRLSLIRSQWENRFIFISFFIFFILFQF